jgi:hypothetical protein
MGLNAESYLLALVIMACSYKTEIILDLSFFNKIYSAAILIDSLN